MRFILFLMRSSWRTVLMAGACGICSGAGSAALISLINHRLNGGGSRFSSSAWWFVSLVVVVLASSLVSQLLLQRLAQKVIYDMRIHICKQVLAAPLRSVEKTGSSRIMASFTEDIGAITGAFLNVPTLCINLTIIVSCLAYLAWISSPSLLLFLIAFLIMAIVTTQILQRKAQGYLKTSRENWEELMGHIRALIDGAKELRLHGRRRHAFVSAMFGPAALLLRRNSNVGLGIYSVSSSWSQVLYFIFIGAILFGLTGRSSIVLISYTLTLLYMRGPIILLLNIYPLFGRASISLKKMEDLGLSLSSFRREEFYETKEEQLSDWRRLQLSGVMFTYSDLDHSFVLGPVDLALHPGEIVFMLGGNGSGKTTFAKLLTGLYAPDAGEVRLGDITITDENRDSYRQHFSVVFSDFYLFDRLLGLDSPDLDETARKYLIKLQLDHKVEVKGGALSTTRLSQGQRKRLALLTAYLEDKPIYVFDEWAADQDPLFRDVFYLLLLPDLKARGKAVLVITHDDRYFYAADRVIKLNYGKVEYDEPAAYPQKALAGLPVG
ncbi:MAG: ABC transporter ATP-binding protein [Acidobacteria bacterium]|nr:MAG: ABC transporter ATP-binding protein [Acidobacteriota bacterium]